MAPLIKHAEEEVYREVQTGELEIDPEGRVWRVKKRGWDRWQKRTVTRRCKRVRAEHDTGAYLQVRAMFQKRRHYCQSSRLVYRHVFGPIPGILTVNHKDGNKKNNKPSNLELATRSQQVIHAIHTLCKHPAANQKGEKNPLAKLTYAAVQKIRKERTKGMSLKKLAARYGVSQQTISKAALGHTWTHVN